MMTFSVKMYSNDLHCVRSMHAQLQGFETARALHCYKSAVISGGVEWICEAMPEFVYYLSTYLEDYRGMFKIDELSPSSGAVVKTLYLKKIA